MGFPRLEWAASLAFNLKLLRILHVPTHTHEAQSGECACVCACMSACASSEYLHWIPLSVRLFRVDLCVARFSTTMIILINLKETRHLVTALALFESVRLLIRLFDSACSSVAIPSHSYYTILYATDPGAARQLRFSWLWSCDYFSGCYCGGAVGLCVCEQCFYHVCMYMRTHDKPLDALGGVTSCTTSACWLFLYK